VPLCLIAVIFSGILMGLAPAVPGEHRRLFMSRSRAPMRETCGEVLLGGRPMCAPRSTHCLPSALFRLRDGMSVRRHALRQFFAPRAQLVGS
jgi:hypothetical protein